MKLFSRRSLLALFLGVGGLLSTSAAAQDVFSYDVTRAEFFTQCTTNRPAPDMAVTHRLYANLVPAYPDAVTEATLTLVYGPTMPLSSDETRFHLLNQSGDTVSLPFPALAGAYRFRVTTANQGVRNLVLTLPAPAVGIRPIRVSNYSEAQAVDAAQPFTVRWDKVTTGTPRDYLRLVIYDEKGNILYNLDRISQSQTEALINSVVLPPNATHRGFLSVTHFLSIHAPPLSLPYWAAIELKVTQFSIRTLNPAGKLDFARNPILAHETNGLATITVERTEGSEGEVTVDYFSADESALSNVNYSAVSGTLTFPPGVTSQSFTVPLLDDGVTNQPLVARFWLTNASGGATLSGPPYLNLTILDSQIAPGINVEAFLLAKVSFYDQRNAGPPDQTTRCVASRCYSSIHPRFPGGASNATVQLPNGTLRSMTNLPSSSLNNELIEYNEDFPTRVSMNSVFRGGKYQFHFDTLTDGSFSPSLTLGAEPVFSVVHLTNWADAQTIDAGAPFTLQWAPFVGATSNDFAFVGLRSSNAVVVRTPVEFRPGALPGLSRSFVIPANTLKYGETYSGSIGFVKVASCQTNLYPGARGCVIFSHTTSVLLHTAPQPPPQGRLQFSEPSYRVSETDLVATITVTRTGGSQEAVSVDYATLSGTAASGTDFTSVAGTLSFAEGETSRTFEVPILDDFNLEKAETLKLVLNNPQGGAILGSPTNAVLTIEENEIAAAGTFQFSATNYLANELKTFATVVVNRSVGLAVAGVSVRLTASGGTAHPGVDYTEVETNLVFAKGEAVKSVRVPLANDSQFEGVETVQLHLSDLTRGGSLGARSNAVISILNDFRASGFAPDSFEEKKLTLTVTTGFGEFPRGVSARLEFPAGTNSVQLFPTLAAATNVPGSYAYSKTSLNQGSLAFTNDASAASYSGLLTFSGTAAGVFLFHTPPGASNVISGRFSLQTR